MKYLLTLDASSSQDQWEEQVDHGKDLRFQGSREMLRAGNVQVD